MATPIPHLVDAVSHDQLVYTKNNLEISAFLVDHAPVYPALGYRLQYQNCKITISGDTKVLQSEVNEAKNADVFISEALNVAQTEAMSNTKKAEGHLAKYDILQDISNYHSDTLKLAQIAQEAQVKHLVLTHIDPPFIPSEEGANKFISGMSQYYKGPIIVASDRDELILTPSTDGACQFEYVPAKK